MKINPFIKKGILTVFIAALVYCGSVSLINHFYVHKSFNAKCVEDRNKLLLFMNRIGKATDSSAANFLTDSCRHFVSTCSAQEIDSLKKFTLFFMQYSNDYIDDVVHSIKDSGAMDTTHLYRPYTLAEMKKLCTESGINYSDLSKDMYALAIAAQNKRDTTMAFGSPEEITNSFRMNILTINKMNDDIRQEFYNKIFGAKQ